MKPDAGPKKEDAPTRLSNDEVSEILEKFSDERINASEHIEYFSIHLKNGRIVRIPKRHYILYADGTKKDVRDEISETLSSDN